MAPAKGLQWRCGLVSRRLKDSAALESDLRPIRATVAAARRAVKQVSPLKRPERTAEGG